jgi:hypothetical protein
MRGNGGGESDLKLIFMNITGLKEGENIRMTQTESVDGKYVELTDTVTTVSGELTNVKIREHKWKDETITEVQLWLKYEKAKELCAVSVGMNSIGRNLINVLLNLVPLNGNLELRVYNKKKDGRPALYIEHNGAKTSWKYSPDEMKKYVVENTVSKGGKTKIERDYFKLNEFLLTELKERVIPCFSKIPAQFVDKEELKKLEAEIFPNDDLPF